MEWFNDSLKIYLFHYWMNPCFWTNLLNEWLKDIFNSPFSPPKKKKDAQTGIDRWNWNWNFTTCIRFLTISIRFWNWNWFSIPNPTQFRGSILKTDRKYRWGEWMTSSLFHLQYPWLSCPWTRHPTPNCSLGATAKIAAHCSGCVFKVCVCSLLTAPNNLDGLNAENKFRVWVTILGLPRTSFILSFK